MSDDDIPPDMLQGHMEDLIEAMRGARPARPGAGDMDTLPGATSAGAPRNPQVRRETSYPQPGTVVSDTWELTEKLGHGGFGVVFAARHLRLGRSDAIKFLHPHLADDARLRERFRREALVMATLRGDHLVVVHDCGEHEGIPFFAMERLDGETLRERLTRGPRPSLDEFFRLARGILGGLAEVHAKGIVHRDIKPENLFLVGETKRVKVLDFGLAMTSERLTSQHTLMGTVLYMAPELLGDHRRDASMATDLYSAGAVLYELLTGVPPLVPHDDETLIAFAVRAGVEHPTPPSERRKDVPLAVDRLLLAAVDKAPEARPATVLALADGLEDAWHAVRRGGGATDEPAPTSDEEDARPVGETKSTPVIGEHSTLHDLDPDPTPLRNEPPRSRATPGLLLALVAAVTTTSALWLAWEPPTSETDTVPVVEPSSKGESSTVAAQSHLESTDMEPTPPPELAPGHASTTTDDPGSSGAAPQADARSVGPDTSSGPPATNKPRARPPTDAETDRKLVRRTRARCSAHGEDASLRVTFWIGEDGAVMAPVAGPASATSELRKCAEQVATTIDYSSGTMRERAVEVKL